MNVRTREDLIQFGEWLASKGMPKEQVFLEMQKQEERLLSGTGGPAPVSEPPPGMGGPHPGAAPFGPEGVGMGPAAQFGAGRGGATLAGTPGFFAGLPIMAAGAAQGGIANLAGAYETADAGFRGMEKAWNMPGGIPWMLEQAEQAGLVPDIQSEDMTMGE